MYHISHIFFNKFFKLLNLYYICINYHSIMIEQETIVNSLEDKFRKLVSLLEVLKAENNMLLKEKEEMISSMNVKDNEIRDLQGKYEHLKLAKLLVTGSEDVHSAKLKVNKIVREIDKCIALLNK
jgi:hypothetical protein